MRTHCWPIVLLASMAINVAPDASSKDTPIATAALDQEIRTFLRNELGAHLAAISSFDPAPARVHGALTTGEFSWGTFMRSLAAYGQLSSERTLAGRDLARTIGEIGLLEVRLGGTRFSQLYGALSLRHYGPDLDRNAVWRSLTPAERHAWRSLLDPTRFYDPARREVINLPENYLGVAARIAAMAWETKLLDDRALLDSLLDRAARQFTSGALYADDALPAGRYDRYSNEYARFVWDAAQIADRKDLLEALRPSLREQMRLWWDLLAPDGYGYQWGRSVGAIGYMDTIEIAAFLAATPEFRPAPLDQLAAAYHGAWRWLRQDFKDDSHLLSIFDFGRGNYGYIGRDREWQQTTGFFMKLANSHMLLSAALREARIARFPSSPDLGPVQRFEYFQKPGRQAGVWVARASGLQFAVPFTTGTRPGVADYLPAPHGLRGFAAPVDQIAPALVPFIELADGRTLVAADGADTIDAAGDRPGVKAMWSRWAQVGAKPAEFVTPGLAAAVEWRLEGSSLVRNETLTASAPLTIARWTVIVPTTGTRWETKGESGTRTDTFVGQEGRLGVTLDRIDWPVAVRVRATGDSPLGRGARGPIPLHLELEAANIVLEPGNPRTWILRLTTGPND